MNREVHVRFWEGLGVRLPRATRLRSEGTPQGALHAQLRQPHCDSAAGIWRGSISSSRLGGACADPTAPYQVNLTECTPCAHDRPGSRASAGKSSRSLIGATHNRWDKLFNRLSFDTRSVR
jgi:hypothetical protein